MKWVRGLHLLAVASLLWSWTFTANGWSNGARWYDTDACLIQAHAGSWLRYGPWLYWYGEDKTRGVPTQAIRCYRSLDGNTWESCGLALEAGTSPIAAESNLERPKVLYHAGTRKFVMWLHREAPDHYGLAEAAVAVADRPEGPFRWLKNFRPFGAMSRDATLFQDSNGRAYFISAARHNLDLHVYRLSSDYLDLEAQVSTLFAGQSREAPVVVEHQGLIYLITSGATYWEANQAMYATAPSLETPAAEWSPLSPLGTETTFQGQGAFAFVDGEHILMGLDRWWGHELGNSRYMILPLQLSAGQARLSYYAQFEKRDEQWHFQRLLPKDGLRIQLGAFHSNRFLRRDSDGKLMQSAKDGAMDSVWTLQQREDGAWALEQEGQYLGAQAQSHALVMMAKREDPATAWDLVPIDKENFGYQLLHRLSGLSLDVQGASGEEGASVGLWKSHDGKHQKWYMVPFEAEPLSSCPHQISGSAGKS